MIKNNDRIKLIDFSNYPINLDLSLLVIVHPPSTKTFDPVMREEAFS